MKRTLRILSIVGLAAVSMMSVAAQDEATTITIAFSESQPQTLDPHAATSVDQVLVLRNTCEGLMDYDPVTLQPIPGLAENTTVSEDGLVYTFTLRSGVTFSDGSALDANDVKYSYDRLSNPAFGTSYTASIILGDVAGWAEARPPVVTVAEGTPTPEPVEPAGEISGVKVIDDLNVEITLTRPVTSFLTRLTLPSAAIIAEGSAEAGFDNGPVCVGPYAVSEFIPNDRLTLTATDNYWGLKPDVKTAIIRVIPEASSQVIEFEAGSLDMSIVPEADLPRILADEDLASQVMTIPSLGLYNFRMNLKDPKVGDVRVRQALAIAIDRQVVIDTVLQGQGIAAQGLFPPGLPAYDETYQPFPRDIEKAKALLAEAGYPDGIELTVRTDQNEVENRVLNAIAATVAEAGITLNINSTEAAIYTQDRTACTMEMGGIRWGMDYPDPENMVVLLLPNAATRRNCGYGEVDIAPQLQELYNQAISMPLGEERDAVFREIQKLAIDNVLILPIYNGATTRLVSPRLSGLPLDSSGQVRLSYIVLADS